jgi:hypothetical protein
MMRKNFQEGEREKRKRNDERRREKAVIILLLHNMRKSLPLHVFPQVQKQPQLIWSDPQNLFVVHLNSC